MHGCHSRDVALTNAFICITVIGEDAFGGEIPHLLGFQRRLAVKK